jgi:hypothetical protein
VAGIMLLACSIPGAHQRAQQTVDRLAGPGQPV